MKATLFIAGLLVVCSAGSLMGQRGAGAGPPNPFLGNSQAVSEGENLYSQKCTTCHGSGGAGGEIGPAIVSGDRLDIGVSDAQTFTIIKNGVAGETNAGPPLPPSRTPKNSTSIPAAPRPPPSHPPPPDVAPRAGGGLGAPATSRRPTRL